MDENSQGFVAAINTMFGGATTTLIGAFVGRLMWHVTEAKQKRRKLLGWELVWELPIAFGMAIIGEGLASWWHLVPPVSTGLVAALAYLGPRGAQNLLESRFLPRDQKKTD